MCSRQKCEFVRAGEATWFDDGKIGGVVEKVENTRVLVRITQARLRGENPFLSFFPQLSRIGQQLIAGSPII